MPDYLVVIDPLVRSFRDEILELFGDIEHEMKDDKTVVTDLDKKIEQAITEALTTEFPDIGIHGEEFGRQGNESQYWTIDPIDGTENLIRGIHGIGTMLALIEDDVVQFAAIYDPIDDVLFHAARGEGAYKNGEKITLEARPATHSFIEINMSGKKQQLIDLIKYVKSEAAQVVSYHGAANKAAMLLNGQIDGTIKLEAASKDWDNAPQALLLAEAGYVIKRYDTQSEVSSRSYYALHQNVVDVIGDELDRLFNQ